jgi:DNA-directed RNA polymerase subunit alpha
MILPQLLNTILGKLEEDCLLTELSLPEINCITSTGNYGKFHAEPLSKGFGVTLGNALRRVLLSSLPGSAVTWILIEGIQHEFTVIPYAKEDVIELSLNVKQLRLRALTDKPGNKLVLDVAGEGEIQAADIEPTADYEIANPELHLASLDSAEARLYIEFNVEQGRGYHDGKSTVGLPVGALPVDAIFTPVRKANFSVEPVSPGEESSLERLVLEIWTDSTITPGEALRQSASILVGQFSSFAKLDMLTEEGESLEGKTSAMLPEQQNTALEELGLSVRAYNSLRRGGISTLGQLIELAQDGLPPLPGLGAKSRTEVESLLASYGFQVPDKSKRKVE